MGDGFYSGAYRFSSTNNFYIHKNVGNIGRANKTANPETSDSLVKLFNQSRDLAREAVKKTYINLFRTSLNRSGRRLLKQATDLEDFITQFHQQLGQALVENLSTDKLQQLMNKEIVGSDENLFNNILRVKDNATGSTAQQALNSFNTILESISHAVDLISDDVKGILRFALSLDAAQNPMTMHDMGVFLQNHIKSFSKACNGMGLSDFELQQIQQICSTVNALAKNFKTGKNSSGDDIKGQGLATTARAIFNTGLAEAIAGDMKIMANDSLIKGMREALLTGEKSVQFAITDDDGNIITTSGDPKPGKADVMFKNVKFSFQKSGTNESTDVEIDIGLSNKFYMSANFPGVISGKDNSFSLSAGGKLTDILDMLFQTAADSERYKYLSYNVIAHSGQSQLSAAWAAFKHAVLTRNIVYAAATRGGKQDFAQFLFLNNQIVSIWSVVLDVIKSRNLGNSPVRLDFNGDELKKARSAVGDNVSTAQRVQIANTSINSMYTYAHLNLNSLSSALIHTA